MRTLDLVKALTEEEMKDVTQLLSENKRKSLLLLFNELEKHKQLEAEPDNAKLFKKVFSKSIKNTSFFKWKLGRTNQNNNQKKYKTKNIFLHVTISFQKL